MVMSLTLIYSIALAASSPTIDPVRTCDVAATHPDDPDKVAPGWEREEIDLVSAENQCRAALKIAPERARTAYHLGRAIYYQGRHKESLPLLEYAANAGYRQAMFVVAYVHTVGGEITKDYCKAQELWLRAAALEHPWSAFHLIAKQLDGSFAKCEMQIDDAHIDRLLKLAQAKITFGESAGRLEKLADRVASQRAAEDTK